MWDIMLHPVEAGNTEVSNIQSWFNFEAIHIQFCVNRYQEGLFELPSDMLHGLDDGHGRHSHSVVSSCSLLVHVFFSTTQVIGTVGSKHNVALPMETWRGKRTAVGCHEAV